MHGPELVHGEDFAAATNAPRAVDGRARTCQPYTKVREEQDWGKQEDGKRGNNHIKHAFRHGISLQEQLKDHSKSAESAEYSGKKQRTVSRK